MAESLLFSAAAERNQQPILDCLQQVLPASGLLLEIASGTGQHAVAFASAMPGLTWQPSDPTEKAIASIRARVQAAGLSNLRVPVDLDVERKSWPIESADAIYCANMLHIAPWSAGLALLEGAARVLQAGSPLIFYGPFFRQNVETAQGNKDFDADLKRRNPAWGIRRLEAVAQVANVAGFDEDKVVELPANNLLVVFRRQPT